MGSFGKAVLGGRLFLFVIGHSFGMGKWWIRMPESFLTSGCCGTIVRPLLDGTHDAGRSQSLKEDA